MFATFYAFGCVWIFSVEKYVSVICLCVWLVIWLGIYVGICFLLLYSVYTPYPLVGLLLHLGALSFSSKYAWDTLSFCYLRIATCDVIFLVWCSFSYGSSDWILWGCTCGLGVCLLSWMCVVCFHSTYSPIFHQLCSFLTLSWVFVKLDYFHCQDSLLVLVILLVDSRSIGYVSVTKGSEFCFWYCSPWVLPWRPLLLFRFDGNSGFPSDA